MRKLSGVAGLAAATAALALFVPGGDTLAQPAQPQPTLTELMAQAKQLEFQINSLSEQFDGLRIQLSRAQSDEKIAEAAQKRAAAALVDGQQAVAQLAAGNYMGSGLDPTLQALGISDPGQFLSQASTIAELDQNRGNQVNLLNAAERQAQRARETAQQQVQIVQQIQASMAAKKQAIDAKINKVNNAALAKAMAIYTQTGSYPNFNLPTANTIGAEALQYALTKRGDAYTWGAAGPSLFDCSGLVVWAYSQLGISLPHFTGDLWNSGVHVSRNDLEPGDLIFFFSDLSHVGIFLGGNLMIDAPTYGIPVGVHPIFWDAYAGAVRIE